MDLTQVMDKNYIFVEKAGNPKLGLIIQSRGMVKISLPLFGPVKLSLVLICNLKKKVFHVFKLQLIIS